MEDISFKYQPFTSLSITKTKTTAPTTTTTNNKRLLAMEGLRKKRKMMKSDDDDDEDVKMETFFALLRNVKDIRDRFLGLQGTNDRAKTTMTTAAATMRATRVVETEEDKYKFDDKIWQPSFQPEDFGEIGVVNTGLSGPAGGGGNCPSLNKPSNEEDDELADERVMNNRQDGDNNNNNNNNKEESKDKARIVLDLNLSL